MNPNTSNQTATLEPLTKTTKVSRLHQGVDLSGKNLNHLIQSLLKTLQSQSTSISSQTRKYPYHQEPANQA